MFNAIPKRILKASLILLMMFANNTWAWSGHEVQSDAADTLVPNGSALHHESVFSNYQSYADETAQSWKAANDLVGEIGGWRTYLREAAMDEGGDSGTVGEGADSGHHHHHHH